MRCASGSRRSSPRTGTGERRDGQAREAAEGARQAGLPAVVRAVPARAARRRRRRGRPALRHDRGGDPRCGAPHRHLGAAGRHGHVPAQRPLRHRLGLVRGRRRDRHRAPRRDRRCAAALGPRGRGADRGPAVPLGVARERGQRVARVASWPSSPQARRRRPAGSPSPRPRPTSRSDSSARRSPRAGSSSSTTSTPRGERGRRRVDPLRIISQDADWYLQAFCHTREDVRNFRVDRMSELVLTDEPIGDHSHRTVPDTLFQGSDSDLDVVVDVSPGDDAAARPTTSPTRPPARWTAGCASRCDWRTCTA